jgi:heme O synthase-like polyprenyltransferase
MSICGSVDLLVCKLCLVCGSVCKSDSGSVDTCCVSVMCCHVAVVGVLSSVLVYVAMKRETHPAIWDGFDSVCSTSRSPERGPHRQ